MTAPTLVPGGRRREKIDELAARAGAHFDRVEAVPEPRAALARGHALGEPVLVTGSLYLLGDIAQRERRAAWRG